MRSVPKILTLIVGAAAIAACHTHPAQNQAANEISMEDNIVQQGQILDNAQIETLPADESSTTPSNQLQNGYDNPDVNDLGNGQ
jgi:hypothetical protein